jgi:hypothetical protein
MTGTVQKRSHKIGPFFVAPHVPRFRITEGGTPSSAESIAGGTISCDGPLDKCCALPC